MRNKSFINEDGHVYYRVYSSRDFFDGNLFPLPKDQKWADILGVKGKNAERNAELKANTIFRRFIKEAMVDMIADETYFILPIKGFGKLGVINHKYVTRYSKLTGEHNFKMCLFMTNEFKSQVKRTYYLRPTQWGRNLLLRKSVNRFKYGRKRINPGNSRYYIPKSQRATI